MSYSMLKSSEYKDRSFILILAIVIGVHGLLIGWMAIFQTFSKPLPPPAPKRLLVQTVSLSSPPTTIRTVEAPSEIAAIEPPVEEVPPPVGEPEEKLIEEPVKEVVEAPKEIETPLPVAEAPPPPMPKPSPPEPKKAATKPAVKKPAPKPVAPKPAPPKKPTPAPKKTPPKPTPKPAPKKASPPKQPPKEVTKPKKEPEKPKVDKAAAEKAAQEKKEAEKRAAEVLRQKEAEKQAQKARQQKLLSEAQESIAKIGQSRDKSGPAKSSELSLTSLPVAISSLHIDDLPGTSTTAVSHGELSYRDELAGRLKLLLKLPEYGEVKVKLTLTRAGKVAKVVVVSAESTANKKHIEKTLPSLTFPGFGVNFNDAAEYTFVITLSNEL